MAMARKRFSDEDVIRVLRQSKEFDPAIHPNGTLDNIRVKAVPSVY